MIIWGSGGGSVTLGELGEQECSVCGKHMPFQAVLHYTYSHIWYLISWVTKREYFAVCGNCGNGFPLDAEKTATLFPRDGIPFLRKKGWMVGLLLVVLLVGFGLMARFKDKEQYEAYLAGPQVGDVYLANLARIEGSGYENAGQDAYGYMKLVHMEGGQLVFVLSQEAYSKKKGVRRALASVTGSSYDLDAPLPLSLEQVRELYDWSIIYEIKRD